MTADPDANSSSETGNTQEGVPELARRHMERLRAIFDNAPPPTSATLAYRRVLGHYYNLLIPPNSSVLEIGCGGGELLAHLDTREVTGIDFSPKQIDRARSRVPYGRFLIQSAENIELPGETFDYIIISDTLNLLADVQSVLERLRRFARSDTRLLANFHSALWRPLLSVATLLGLRNPAPPSNWLATSDVLSLLALTDWEPVKTQPRILVPFRLGGFGSTVNRAFAPLFSWFSLSVFCVARLRPSPSLPSFSVSVIIPARNESGNIEAAAQRIPEMGTHTELIFVEGHSRDNTWAEIQRVAAAYGSKRAIKIMQQTGVGKGNAVREGFAAAGGSLLMILDADLTMPPEELTKFYHAVASGKCELANGCRLVYPLEDEAMRFLNLCANKAFSILFTWLLRQPIKDTLCGTKVLTKDNYLKVIANRSYFGDFDPFGDFDLLFGAAKLNLKINDVPIRYRDRTYGQTNIHRWKHGWLLLRMVGFAARKLTFV